MSKQSSRRRRREANKAAKWSLKKTHLSNRERDEETKQELQQWTNSYSSQHQHSN